MKTSGSIDAAVFRPASGSVPLGASFCNCGVIGLAMRFFVASFLRTTFPWSFRWRCGAGGISSPPDAPANTSPYLCSRALGYPRAFSLTELMVVIFIIALLVGLIAQNIGKSHRLAHNAKCQNNLRQYGVALGKLFADYDGYFPDAYRVDKGGYLGGLGCGAIAYMQAGGDTEVRAYDPLSGGEVEFDFTEGFPKGLVHVTRGAYGTQTPKHSATYNFNQVLASIPDSETRHCPALDYRKLIDPHSPQFKGESRCWDPYNRTNVYYDDLGYISNTTYTYNSWLTVEAENASRHRSDVPADKIFVIDWNATLGWQGQLHWHYEPHDYPCWEFSNPQRGIVQGVSKGTNWWKTEIGFNHLLGQEYCANYVCIDGRVTSVSSNDIKERMFKPWL